MKFKIVSYDAEGQELLEGEGEFKQGKLSVTVVNTDLQKMLDRIIKQGGVPAREYMALLGEEGEHLDGRKMVSISNPQFLSYLSDYLVYWSIIKLE